MGSMPWGLVAAILLGLLIVSAVMHKRRGLGRMSWLPWDYLMILWAIMLVGALAQWASHWRDGL